MTAISLANELTTLIAESKRKNSELKTAAEKSLQELKALPNTSEEQLAADLSRRPTFVTPFLLACETRNAKFASSGVTCLQRLVVSKGLPKGRLQDALNAFNICTELGLDVQLKVLQALPSLLQSYADELKGDLLAAALQVCAALQSAKAQTVSGVASATLQQLVTAVFERVVDEDKHSPQPASATEVPGRDGPVAIRPAADDAFRVFRDLALAADERDTKFVRLPTLSPNSSLELIWSCINANPRLFVSHSELSSIIRSNVLPTVTRAISDKLPYSTTVRSMRVLDLILSRHFLRLLPECEVGLGLLTLSLDTDSAVPWKRALSMEVLRNFFGNSGLAVEAYAAYDQADDGKTVIQDVLSAFVRLSAEKPAAIGLAQQSSVPLGPGGAIDSEPGQSTLEGASGVTGAISSALRVTEASIPGISSRWSIPRVACLDQLDKTESSIIPETYVYALVLECLNSLSDALARIVLPITVQHDGPEPSDVPKGPHAHGHAKQSSAVPRLSRSQSFRRRAVPLNPLQSESGPMAARARTVASLIETCWPAVLATSSTFLNAALEDHYYRGLIKSYQRFTQVSGLLRLSTSRDAFMTTLSKSAVPPQVLNAAMADGAKSPTSESPRAFSNPKSLLSVESLVSQASTLSIDRERRTSMEPTIPVLTVRNLLCLRALLNLAIALGPTLETAYTVVLNTLRQADMILSTGISQQVMRQAASTMNKSNESPSAVQAFSAEVAAVEAAASRLFESSADYPNEAFVNVIKAFIRLLGATGADSVSSLTSSMSPPPTPPSPSLKQRTFSGLPGMSTFTEMRARDYQFVIPKLGNLAAMNVARFAMNDPAESGWLILVNELTGVATRASCPREARRSAAAVLCRMSSETIAGVVKEETDVRAIVQRRALAVSLKVIHNIFAVNGELTTVDLEIQSNIMEALRTILERCGDSLVAGWNKSVGILASAFKRTTSISLADQHDVESCIDWSNISSELVSDQVGRTAFAVVQVVCSDFLEALPLPVLPSLIELLYRFMCQQEDLNVALTTVTMAWNVSDHLFNSITADELDRYADDIDDADAMEEQVQSDVRTSRTAQILLLLWRLRDAVRETEKEVCTATFQTICSIFKNHGDQLGPAAWDLTLRSVIMRILAEDGTSLGGGTIPQETADVERDFPDVEMSKAIVTGAGDVLAQHMALIERTKRLASLWGVFLLRIEVYLDLKTQGMNAAVYAALAKVLTCVSGPSPTWTTPAYRTLALWLNRVPEVAEGTFSKDSNQAAFSAYIDTAIQLYRLTADSMGTSQMRKLIDNVYTCIRDSDGPSYSGDSNALSPLQSRAMGLLQDLRTDMPNIPSRIVAVAGQLSILHHDTRDVGRSKSGPTFIALASESIKWLQNLVNTHIRNPEILETGALLSGMQSLRRIVVDKYRQGGEHGDTALWREATIAALALSQTVLQLTEDTATEETVKESLWAEYVAISAGIAVANGLQNISDNKKVYTDEQFDIEKFKALRQVLIPRLGQPTLPDELRSAYCRSVFEASIVHEPEAGEIPELSISPLAGLHKIRRGRIKKVPYSRRERMSYVCFEELISLASGSGDSVESVKLAQSAAPLLILRLAIPIRAYIADQPLRGKKPQPLSELEELLYCFEQIKTLKLHREALAADPVADGRHGPSAHLHYLYPLLANAIREAGDEWSGTQEVLMPLQRVLEAITPIP